MAFFKKLKTFFQQKPQTSKPTAHLSPITNRIGQWLDDKGWKYDHILPDDDDELRTHHFSLGFRDDNDYFWHCFIRIHEKNQIVTITGLPAIEIDKAYFLQILTTFNTINNTLAIGSFELNTVTSTVHARISFDAEFTTLSDQALDCYLQGLAGLTERVYEVVSLILKDPKPNQNFLDLLKEQGGLDDKPEIDQDGNHYFVPTHTAQ